MHHQSRAVGRTPVDCAALGARTSARAHAMHFDSSAPKYERLLQLCSIFMRAMLSVERAKKRQRRATCVQATSMDADHHQQRQCKTNRFVQPRQGMRAAGKCLPLPTAAKNAIENEIIESVIDFTNRLFCISLTTGTVGAPRTQQPQCNARS